MKTNKIVTLAFGFLASISFLSACSSNTYPTQAPPTNTDTSQSSIPLGEYLNQSKKKTQIWFGVNASDGIIAKDDYVSTIFVVENNNIKSYDIGDSTYESSETKFYRIKADSFWEYSETGFTQEDSQKIAEIVKSYDTTDGNSDGVINIGSIEGSEGLPNLTIGDVAKMSEKEILAEAQKHHVENINAELKSRQLDAEYHYLETEILNRIDQEIYGKSSDNTLLDNTKKEYEAIKNITEKDLITPTESKYKLNITTDSTGNNTFSEILSFPSFNPISKDEGTYKFDTEDMPLSSATIYDKTYMGFIGKKRALITISDGQTLTVDPADTSLKTVTVD